MIGVILAAGKGSRLKDLSKDTPKSLLKLDDSKTLLDYNLNILEGLGIKKVLIVTGFAQDKIVSKVSERTNIDIKTIYNPFWNHCNVLGSLYMALPYITDDFLFLHADTLVENNVWSNLATAKGQIVLPFKKKACGEEEMKVVHDENGKLIKITKEMPASEADGEFLGIAKFSRELIDFIQERSRILFSRGVLNQYMEAVVQEAVDLTNIDISTLDIGDAKFIEVDFENDYREAKKLFGTKQ